MRRVASLLMAFVVAITVVTAAAPGADAVGTHMNVTVANSGNLTIEILRPDSGLRLVPNGLFADVFEVWLYDRNPNMPGANIIETASVGNVTNNVMIRPTDGSMIVVGDESLPEIPLPGDLRVEERVGVDPWTLAVHNATIADDLKVYAAAWASVTIDNSSIGDDTIIDGYRELHSNLINSEFGDRLRVAARETGVHELLWIATSTIGDLLVIGSVGDDRVSVHRSDVGRARFRVRGGDDWVTVSESTLVDVQIATGAGDDRGTLREVEISTLRVTMSGGSDYTALDQVAVSEQASSIISGGGANDELLVLDSNIADLAIRAFESVTSEV